MTVERYDFKVHVLYDPRMMPSANGDWVRYEDHRAALQAVEAERGAEIADLHNAHASIYREVAARIRATERHGGDE